MMIASRTNHITTAAITRAADLAEIFANYSRCSAAARLPAAKEAKSVVLTSGAAVIVPSGVRSNTFARPR